VFCVVQSLDFCIVIIVKSFSLLTIVLSVLRLVKYVRF
jgi:hypothetical protein